MVLKYQLRKLLLAAGGVLLFALPSLGQVTVQPSPYIPQQFFDNNGKILSGGCLATFQSGTSTPLATYSDAAGMNANTNPTQLDSSGRATIFLQSQAYTLTLYAHGTTNDCSTSLGPQIWSIDGINPGANSILSSNNVWTGSNTFNGPVTTNSTVTFNTGFTSLGPNTLGGGGSINGSWGGTPTLTGLWNFAGSFDSVNGVFSGQVFDTIATGTPPFVVASTTEVANLNANLLEGADWASPGTIGSTTPNTGKFTTLAAGTSFSLNGSTPATAVQGNGDTHMLLAGVFSGATGVGLCKDANGGATTSGCALSGVSQISYTSKAPGCATTGGNSFDNCTDTLTWNTPFADTSYFPVCFGQNSAASGTPSTVQAGNLYIDSFTASNITIITQTQRSGDTQFQTIYCIAIHP